MWGPVGDHLMLRYSTAANREEELKTDGWGLPPPEPLGPDLHYFLLGDDAFALMPWLVKL